MKIYLAFRFTGEDPKVLDQELKLITNALTEAGHEVFCSFWKEQFYRDNNFGPKEIINYSLPHLAAANALVAYIKSPEKSEGMLIEIGYALGLKKKVIVAIKNGIQTNFVTTLAQHVMQFHDLADLQHQLKRIV
jgi:nucleoside 2-deoxyribosyltransferase